MSERWILAPGQVSRARVVVTSLAAPAIALGLGLLIQPERELGALSLFLLAVVAAAVVAGMVAGIAASVLGFLALNYFFTKPLHTFHVADRDDVVALATFLVVALVVGWVVGRAVEERARATRREREARLLNYAAIKSLSGEPLERVVNDLAGALVDALRLSGCEVQASVGDRSVVARRGRMEGGTPEHVPIARGEATYGQLIAVPDLGAEVQADDRRLLESAARQIAVALERTSLDAEVADAREEAERSQARAALFSSVTHDLRTPLASIKAAVTSLLQEDVALAPDQQRDLLNTVLEETDRLNRLVGNILELARVRAGALVPAKQATAVDEVVESVLHRMAHRLAKVHVRTIVRDTPEVAADPVQIDQVLTNLLENAVQFSPPDGEVVVSVAPWRSAVRVTVTDHGPGVPPEDRERVFEAFSHGHVGGSGLGLAISRAIVLAHGGRIWIEGAPGGGTAVSFDLPVRDAEPVDQEAVTAEGHA
ncbi:MAG TPA: ATP-binding protein [Actinomycetota bacterium]|jgi:two-component system sensor histidine kinase KdpD|nr:ATP-binding protein [Actinomycetota bacterium]